MTHVHACSLYLLFFSKINTYHTHTQTHTHAEGSTSLPSTLSPSNAPCDSVPASISPSFSPFPRLPGCSATTRCGSESNASISGEASERCKWNVPYISEAEGLLSFFLAALRNEDLQVWCRILSEMCDTCDICCRMTWWIIIYIIAPAGRDATHSCHNYRLQTDLSALTERKKKKVIGQ